MVRTPSVPDGRSFSAGGTPAPWVRLAARSRVRNPILSFIRVLAFGCRFALPCSRQGVRPLFGGGIRLGRMLQPAGWFQIPIRVAGIVRVIGVGIAVPEEILHVFDRDGEANAFPKDLHVGHSSHFASKIEQRSAAVARIDLCRGLNVKTALKLPGL